MSEEGPNSKVELPALIPQAPYSESLTLSESMNTTAPWASSSREGQSACYGALLFKGHSNLLGELGTDRLLLTVRWPTVVEDQPINAH